MPYEIINLQDVNSPSFINHTLISGKSGSGKSNMGEFMLEGYHLKGSHKCIDFDTSGRLENTTYSLPEQNKELISLMKKHPHLTEKYKLEPMGFQDEVILICGRGLVGMNEFPNNFKIMSFKEEDLSWYFLKELLGGTEAVMHSLSEMQLNYGDDINLKDIEDIIFKKEFRGARVKKFRMPKPQRDMVMTRLKSWRKSGLFSKNVKKIDFNEIFKDKKTITCINTILLENEWEEELAYGIVMDKLITMMRRRNIPHRVFLYIREVHDFIHWKRCSEQILHVLRKGRILGKGGCDFFSDTQRAIDLKPIMRRQFGYYFQMKGDMADAEKVLEIQYVPKNILAKVNRYNVGQGIVVTGMRWDHPIQVPPTRHLHVHPKHDIMKLLAEKHKGMTKWDYKKILFVPKTSITPDLFLEYEEHLDAITSHKAWDIDLSLENIMYLINDKFRTFDDTEKDNLKRAYDIYVRLPHLKEEKRKKLEEDKMKLKELKKGKKHKHSLYHRKRTKDFACKTCPLVTKEPWKYRSDIYSHTPT